MNKPSVKELRQTIKKIEIIINELDEKQIYGLEKREDYFFKYHEDIMKLYPFLVSQLCSTTDNSMLEVMLEELEEIEKGEQTNEKADASIGEKLANTYIKNN